MTALTITLALVAVVAAAFALAATFAWRRALAAAVRREDAAERDLAELHERLAVLEASTARPDRTGRVERTAEEREFVITRLGDADPDGDAGRTPARVSVKAPAFADAVLRESVVQTASLVQGVRRALSAETRNRVRFEMKRELKRSRKARKVELKEALREYRARHRADIAPDDVTPDDIAPDIAPDAGVEASTTRTEDVA